MFRFISSILPEVALQRLTGAYFNAQYLRNVGRGKLHSQQRTVGYAKMKIQVLPALSDNYMYLLIDEESQQAAVVDPVNPASVLQAVKEAGVTLTAVLTTHHHWDHASGNEKLVEEAGTPLQVYGGDERIGGLTTHVADGETFTLGGLTIRCIATPCHTTGHVCYYVTGMEGDAAAVFTGDTLFLAGCGKFFEGTADQMHASLTALAALPDATHVYCGHEYARSNLAFSAHVQPGSAAVATKTAEILARRKAGLPSVPSTLAEEKSYNPFMRVALPELMTRYSTADAVESMKLLRQEKDHWKAPAS